MKSDFSTYVYAPGAGGNGGRAIRTRAAADLGASETVTVGTAGTATSPAQAGQPGIVIVDEIVEY